MGTRLRAFIMLAGALLVVATFAYPLWRPEPIEDVVEVVIFPELSAEQQQAFETLPLNVQRAYAALQTENAQRALALVASRLQQRDPLPEEQQALSPDDIAGAVVAAQGVFAPVPDDEFDDREPQPYPELYSVAGDVIIYEFPDERKWLRLENFQVTNGPNLQVIISTLPDPLTGAEVLLDRERIVIGDLLTPIGDQTYTSIPRELELENYRTVVIYESTYNLIFGVARIG